jgi:hypothetical protein
MDLQLIKSSMIRATLVSAAGSLYPRMGYMEGLVAVADIMNPAIGAPVRVKKEAGSIANAVQALETPFFAHQMLPLMTYMDDVKEQRTGQNKGAAGLDASAMQSSTKAAVAAAVTASQAQVEMLARIFAEQTLKPMFRGVLREIIMNQSAVRNIKVRNRWVAVDPREWNANMDLTVNVMLGTGLIEEKVGALIQVSEKQHEILTELGPQNPVV